MFPANDSIPANATASFNKYKIFAGTPKCLCLLVKSLQYDLGTVYCSQKDYVQETLNINYVFQTLKNGIAISGHVRLSPSCQFYF